MTGYMLSHCSLLFQVCLLSSPSPPTSSKILSSHRAGGSHSLISHVSPAAQNSNTMEQALEVLYLNSLSTNTRHLQGEAVQNRSHFLVSAALVSHMPQRQLGRQGPPGPDKGSYTQARRLHQPWGARCRPRKGLPRFPTVHS